MSTPLYIVVGCLWRPMRFFSLRTRARNEAVVATGSASADADYDNGAALYGTHGS
jgi:uncharacterized membrane protein